VKCNSTLALSPKVRPPAPLNLLFCTSLKLLQTHLQTPSNHLESPHMTTNLARDIKPLVPTTLGAGSRLVGIVNEGVVTWYLIRIRLLQVR
jgi:hypothetical protein